MSVPFASVVVTERISIIDGVDTPVVLYFDIYTGIRVYVTEDGNGNVYSDWTLSDFGQSPRTPLFGLSNIASGYSQTASMVVKNQPYYSGMYLGISVKDLIGTPALGEGSNELAEYMVLTVERDGSTYSSSFSDLSGGMLLIGQITDDEDVSIDVTISLSQDASGEYVQDRTLDFTLVVGVLYPSDDGGA